MNEPPNNGTIPAFLREHDRDRYLSVLFAPEPAREALMALYAFGAELVRIPDLVSEPALGEIRLQWWRDALDTVETGGRTGNPLADALGGAMREHNLPKPLLTGMIDARAFDLSGVPMPDMQSFRVYLEKTQGSVFALAARIVTGPGRDDDLDALSRFAGFAWGSTWLLRMMPFHLSCGRFYLPANHFRDYGADPEQLFGGVADERARSALAGLRDEAREAFGYVRAGVHSRPRKTAIVFLPCALVPRYLAALEKQAATPLEGVADINPLRRLSCLAWAALRGRLE